MTTKNRRVTIIKPTVGKVKSSSYSLPDSDFVYGIESKLDKEGAGKVVQSWAQSEPSKPPRCMQSFPATNRQALKHGCLTSKDQREYGKQYPVMKQNPKKDAMPVSSSSQPKAAATGINTTTTTGGVTTGSTLPSAANATDNEPPTPPTTFGIQTKKTKVSMTELLRCIPSELDEEMDYPDLSGMKRKGRLPQAKSTKASRVLVTCREERPEEEVRAAKAVEEFKMKKFLNVPSKVDCRR
mmetsp:Transcript_27524/g.55401  ORF Transcript_27524/g.55401 Transcript_27524/m.55401 type:complete len:240 (-) Transcript_27524:228-947(-)